MQLIRLALFGAACLVCLPAKAQAQEESNATEVREPKGRTVKFTIYTWFDESKILEEQVAPPELFYRSGRSYLPITMRPAETGFQFVSSVTDGKLILFKQEAVDEKIQFVPAHEVKLRANTTEIFLYLFQFDGKTQILSVDTSSDVFPKSNFAFVNAAKQAVDFSINGKVINVKPRSIKITPYSISEEGTLRIVVKSKDETPRTLSVMTVGGRKDQRVIGFFYMVNQGRAYRLLLERGVDSQAFQFEIPTN